MTRLSDPRDVLTVWESAADVTPAARGAALAHQLGFAADLDTALDLSLAECASISVRAFIESYGTKVDGVVRCTTCGETLEVQMPLDGLDLETIASPTETVTTTVGDVKVRSPTTRDLLLAGSSESPVEALLVRCVSSPEGRPVQVDLLSVNDRATVDAACERLSGLAGVVLATECPACGATVQAGIDPAALWWQRIQESARRVVAEVSALAGAFGWSESDVLAMSPGRRAAYLAVVTP